MGDEDEWAQGRIPPDPATSEAHTQLKKLKTELKITEEQRLAEKARCLALEWQEELASLKTIHELGVISGDSG